MTFGIEMGALAALPFAAALGLGSALAAFDVATRSVLGFVLAIITAIVLVGVLFACLTQTIHADFRTEVLGIAPLTALVGLFVGYALRKSARPRAAR